MLLRARQTVRHDGGRFAPGEVFEISDSEAISRMISTGAAESLDGQPATDVEDIEAVDLEDMTVNELRELAKSEGLQGYSSMKKEELIDLIDEHFNGDGADG